MSIDSIVLIILILAVGFLYYDRFLTDRHDLPDLGKGERIPVIKKGQSNLALGRRGTETFLVDEEGTEMPFKEKLK